MLKSNLEPKNKILNIYLNCQLKSNEPVLQYSSTTQYQVTSLSKTQTELYQSVEVRKRDIEDCEQNDSYEILFVILCTLYR